GCSLERWVIDNDSRNYFKNGSQRLPQKSRSKGLGSGRVQRTVTDEARPHRVRGQNLRRPDENGSTKRKRDQLPRKSPEAQVIRSHTRPRKQRTTTHSARQTRTIHGSLTQ